MLEPKRFKYGKMQKPVVDVHSKDFKFIEPFSGTYALKAITSGGISNIQLLSARLAIMKSLKKKGNLLLRVFPDKAITKKPSEVGMGKGKGNFYQWVSLVSAGRVIFELAGDKLPLKTVQEAFRVGGERLPLGTKFVIGYK